MPAASSDRNLLYGILALQMEFVRRDELVAAMNAWVLDKAKPLGAVLLERRALAADEHTLLDALVDKHLEKHGQDPSRSLAALRSTEQARQALKDIADPELQASLARVSRAADGAESAGCKPAATARFRILRPHARGGLGEVAVALDEELQREVALKQIQAQHADDPVSRARFLLEAEITGRLEHPGVVPIYGLGHYADGRPFYAMRFIKGNSLAEAIRRFHQAGVPGRDAPERTLALRELLRRFVDVCNAVAYAHSKGVLHRDLKPGNVMLGPYGETLVVDWGLGRAMGPAVAGAAAPLQPSTVDEDAVTRAGTVLGTPQFMSPEQAAGRLAELGAASDVYSLGATLYCLLTGQAPFEKGDTEAILEKVRQGDFPPPRQVQPATPAPLQAICLKAMALRPEDRYSTALALAEDVERWLADEPVRAHRDGWRERAARWRRRHKTAVAAAAALLLAGTVALAIAVVWVRQAFRKEADQRARAAEARRLAEAAEVSERTARTRAEEARRATLRTAVANYRSSADACLAEARVLWNATNRPDRQQAALDLLRRAAAFERQARQTVQQLAKEGVPVQGEEVAREERHVRLRNEASRWLTAFALGRTRTLTLPPPPAGHKQAVALSLQDIPNKFHRSQVDWSGWSGLLAFSPDGSRAALAYAGSGDLLLLACDGSSVRRLPLPAEMGVFRLGLNSDALRFIDDLRIEWSSVAAVVTWSSPESPATVRRRSPPEQDAAKRRIAQRRADWLRRFAHLVTRKGLVAMATSSRFTAFFEHGEQSSQRQQRITVRPTEGGASRTVFFTQVPFRQLIFGHNPHLLYALSDRGVTLIDAERGLTASQNVFEAGEQGTCLDVRPCGTGAATLESVVGPGAGLRLSLWHTIVSPAWKVLLLHELPITRLDLADDGQAVTGGLDGVVGLWQGSRRLWARGIVLRRRLGLNARYPWWQFLSGGRGLLAVERRNLPSDRPAPADDSSLFYPQWLRNTRFKDRPHRTVLDLYDPVSGKRLHSFPATGAGRILLASPDQRFALVVAEEKGDSFTLDLWSLEEGKRLGRLGTYLARHEAAILKQERQEVVSALTPFFSPGGRWLLLVRHRELQVEVWKLPHLKCVGKVAVRAPWLRVEFDSKEHWALLAGVSTFYPETRGAFAQHDIPRSCEGFFRVVELKDQPVVRDLEDVASRLWVVGLTVRFVEDRLLVVGQSEKDRFFTAASWNLKTAKKTALLPSPKESDPRQVPNGTLVRLSHDRKRMLLLGFQQYQDKSHKQAVFQLWDVAGARLLRQERFQDVSQEETKVVGDRDAIHVYGRNWNAPKLGLTLRSWKWQDGADVPPGDQQLVAVDRANRWALWSGKDGAVLYDDATGRSVPLEDTVGTFSKLFRAALSPDGLVFALERQHIDAAPEGGWRQSVELSGLWDVRSGRRLLAFPSDHSCRAFDPSGRWLGTLDLQGGEVRVWDIRARQLAHRLAMPTLRGNSMGLSTHTYTDNYDLPGWSTESHSADLRVHPDGKRVAVLSKGVIRLWDAESGQLLQTVPKSGHSRFVFAVAQHAGAGLVASSGGEGEILLWERRGGRLRGALLGHNGAAVPCLAFSPDGSVLASGGDDGTVRCWQPDGRCVWTFEDRKGTTFFSLAFNPRSGVLAAGTSDGRILFLDVKARKLLTSRSTDGFAVRVLAWSRNGDRLACGSASGLVRLWRDLSKEPQRTLDTGTAVSSLLFGPGDLLVTGGAAIQFWRLANGRKLWQLEEPFGPVTGLALDNNKELLLTAAQRVSVRALDLAELDRQLRHQGLDLPGSWTGKP